MTPRSHRTLLCAIILALTGCGQRSTDEAAANPAKMDAEMEKAARDIESRANAAAAEVEREAAAELERIEAEAKAAPAEEVSEEDESAGQNR